MTSMSVLSRDRFLSFENYVHSDIAFLLVPWQRKLHADATDNERRARANRSRSDPGSYRTEHRRPVSRLRKSKSEE